MSKLTGGLFFIFWKRQRRRGPGPMDRIRPALLPASIPFRGQTEFIRLSARVHGADFLRVRQVTPPVLRPAIFITFESLGRLWLANLRAVFNTRTEITVSSKDTLAAGFDLTRTSKTQLHYKQEALLSSSSHQSRLFCGESLESSSRLYLIAGIRLDDLRTIHPLTNGEPDHFIPANVVIKANPAFQQLTLPRRAIQTGHLARRVFTEVSHRHSAPRGFELAFTDNAPEAEKA